MVNSTKNGLLRPYKKQLRKNKMTIIAIKQKKEKKSTEMIRQENAGYPKKYLSQIQLPLYDLFSYENSTTTTMHYFTLNN